MRASLLLLTTLATSLCSASSQGDPASLSLVELVRSSPITSIEDLWLLLSSDTTEGHLDNVSEKRQFFNNTSHRRTRSIDPDVPVAEPAQCKVRTEVLEVTRSMIDRRNANFLPWPSCIEVQRCSGCCNNWNMKCVPTVTRTRKLQAMKIQYVNMKPNHEKVVISVEDHVACSCQKIQSPLAVGTTVRKPQPAVKPPQTIGQTKQEIHRHDEIKHNQKAHLEDTATQGYQWQVKNLDPGMHRVSDGKREDLHSNTSPASRTEVQQGVAHGVTKEPYVLGYTAAGTESNQNQWHQHRLIHDSIPAKADEHRHHSTVKLKSPENGGTEFHRENQRDNEKHGHQHHSHQNNHHQLDHQALQQSTTSKLVTAAPTTKQPSLSTTSSRSPVRLRKRLRKNKNKIRKSTIRAMLM